ncbi:MAG TPA: SHOCT domain-containing protein [Acidimicrobiales bacterium]|nr:SHOCT domain-containing protein [Acidimicrobiales bacterium]
MIAATTTYTVGQVVWTLLWFFLLFIEVWLTISIFIDIFRSHDLKGWQKALWILLVLILPLVGILAYFVARGDKMRAHQQQAQADEEAVNEFLRRRHAASGGGGSDSADQLSRLAELRQDGIISEQEFEQFKSRVIKHDSNAAT